MKSLETKLANNIYQGSTIKPSLIGCSLPVRRAFTYSTGQIASSIAELRICNLVCREKRERKKEGEKEGERGRWKGGEGKGKKSER